MRAAKFRFLLLATACAFLPAEFAESGNPAPAGGVKPIPVVVASAAPAASDLSPAEREKLRLLEGGDLSDGPEPRSPKTFPREIMPPAAAGDLRYDCFNQLATSGQVYAVPPSVPGAYYVFVCDQAVSYWSAVGVRSQPGDDWDIELYADGGGFFAPCVSTLIGYSNRASGVDFVVGDFNHVGSSEDFAFCTRYGGSQDGDLEWDDGADALIVNGPPVTRTTGPDDILEAWDIYLESGRNYGFRLAGTGNADLRLLLFRNTGSGTFYVGRNGAEFEQTAGGTALYSPPATDWYGLVVVNDDGGSATYTLEAGTCATPTALASGVSVATPGVRGHYSCNQTWGYWSAVGVRAADHAADWDLELYASEGGSWPLCFDYTLGLTGGFLGRVDFVALDFNAGHNPPAPFYAYPHRTSGTGDARTEWDAGSDLLGLDTWTSRSTGPEDVLETWDVALEADVDYVVRLSRTGADVKALVVPPIPYGWWANRYDALVETGGPCGHFVPTVSAYHAAIVVNDDGGTGSYALRIGEQFIDATSPPFSGQFDSRTISAADYDGDGYIDFYLTVSGAPDKLYRSDFGDAFTEVIPSPFVHPGIDVAPVWGDYDNDGDLDIFVAVNIGGHSVLYRNDGGGVFVDVSAPPLDFPATAQSASWADYDQDGFIDLFVPYGGGDRLYHNERNGTFSVATPSALQFGVGRDGAWGDYDNDGDPDLYVAKSDGYASQLLRNTGGSFTDVTPGPLAASYTGAANASWVDYDDDLDLDLFVADDHGGHLLRNDGGGLFTDVTAAPLTDVTMSPAHAWGDYDNNGYPDLFLSNLTGRARLLRNDVWYDGTFKRALGSRAAGAENHWGVTLGDIEQDGDLDAAFSGTDFWIYDGANRLLLNQQCADRNWLEVKLVGTCSNRFGVGARIMVVCPYYVGIREVGGRSGDCSYVSHFGLGAVSQLDYVEVRWPNGYVQQIENVAVNQVLTIVEGSGCATGVEQAPGLPRALALQANVPNPFDTATSIRYDLPTPGPARLAVYDVSGRLLRVLVDRGLQPAGRFGAVWDGRASDGEVAGTGVYFCRLEAEGRVLTRKVTLVR